jgi:hypothetical protein
MKSYLFEIHFQNTNLTAGFNFHREMFECHADAQVHARKIFAEAKRDVNAFLIQVYVKNRNDWKLIAAYQ